MGRTRRKTEQARRKWRTRQHDLRDQNSAEVPKLVRMHGESMPIRSIESRRRKAVECLNRQSRRERSGRRSRPAQAGGRKTDEGSKKAPRSDCGTWRPSRTESASVSDCRITPGSTVLKRLTGATGTGASGSGLLEQLGPLQRRTGTSRGVLFEEIPSACTPVTESIETTCPLTG